MNDTSQQLPTSQENDSPALPASSALTPQSPTSKRKNWIIAGIGAGILCLCVAACAAIFGTTIFKTYKEKAPVESVLDSYMKAMANQDAESAYALFSPRVHRTVPISKIEELLEGNNYALFEDYQALSVGNVNISAAVNTNPDLPQGIVAKVNGVVTYENDVKGTFNSTLEKVDGQWMIDGIFVSVPPSKIK